MYHVLSKHRTEFEATNRPRRYSWVWCGIVALLLLLSALPLRAQRYDHIWYFGNGAGIDFRTGTAAAIGGSGMNAYEGTAVATDSVTQRLVFYTDGISVWDSTNTLILTGLMGGRSSTQAALIVPAPGFYRRYYIFTTALAEGGTPSTVGLRYTLLDFTRTNFVLALNQPLIAPTCEKVTAVGNCDGTSFWIITHKWASDEFYSYRLNQWGLDTTPVISAVGPTTPLTVPLGNTSLGYLSASPDGTRLAMGVFEPGNYAGIYSFNNSTGVVSEEIPLLNDMGVYGICFSPDGSKVYTGAISGRTILQFDLSSDDSATIVASRTLIYSGGRANIGALEPAVDGRIYVARSGESIVGVIDSPNVAGVACSYRHDGLVLPSPCAWGLPNVVVSFGGTFRSGVGLSLGNDTSFCPGQQMQLHASGADRYQWSPATGLSCTDCPDPIANSDTTITYIVTGFIDSGCVRSVKDTITLTVGGNGLPVDARGTQTICPGSEAFVTAEVDPAAYILWSSSSDPVPCDTCHLLRVRPARTTTYYLDAWIRGGCAGRDSVTVIVDPNALKIDAAGGGSICVGGSSLIGVDAPPSSQVLWNPWGTLDCDTCATTEARPTRTTMYYVDVFDSTGCRGRDSVLVVVDTVGILVDAVGGTTICPGSRAQLSISNFLGSFHIKWSPAVSCDTCTEVEVRPTATTMYTVEVWDDRGCRGSDTVTVTVDTSLEVVASGSQSVCEGGIAFLTVDAPPGARVRWSPSDEVGCDTCQSTEVRPTATRFYRVEIEDSAGCRGEDSIEVEVKPLLSPSAGGGGVICPGDSAVLSVNVPAGSRVRWTPPLGVACDTCAATGVRPASSTTYRVQVLSDEACYALDSVRVTIDSNRLPVELLGVGSICPGASAELEVDAPEGVHIRWHSSGDPLPCDTCEKNVVRPATTTTYWVECWSDAGCRGRDTFTVSVSANGLAVDAGAGDSICAGGVATLVAAVPPGSRVRWSPASGLSCDTCATTEARPAASTLYHLLVEDPSGCRGEDSVEIVVTAPVSLTVVGGGSICRGDSATLSVSVPPGSRVRWTPSTGLSCDTCAVTVARPTATTTYRAELLNPSPCDAPGSAEVEVRAPVVVVVELGDAVLRPGTPASLPVRLRGLPAGTSISEIKLGVRYDPSMLRLESAGGAGPLSDWVALNADDRWRDGWYSAQFRSPFGGVLSGDGEVIELKFGSYYGGTSLSSVVAVEELELTGLSCMEVNGVGGGVRLDSLCWALMRGVELSPFGVDKVVGVYPSPAREEVGVVLNVGEEVEVELVVVDAGGVEHRLGGGVLVGGEHELVVGVGGLSSGWYRLVARVGSRVIGSRLLLVIH